jgi:hypothetical protein
MHLLFIYTKDTKSDLTHLILHVSSNPALGLNDTPQSSDVHLKDSIYWNRPSGD